MIKFGVLTVSTTCSKHPEKDTAGPTLESEIAAAFPNSQISFRQVVTDDKQEIIDILTGVANSTICDVMFTVGGTGFAPSDVTPEATKAVIEKEAPGLVHAMISRSLPVTDMAMLSRPICGIKDKTIFINFPGSAKAAVECFSFVKKSLTHAVALLKDDGMKVRLTHEKIQSGQREDGLFEESKVKIIAGESRIRKSQYPMTEVEDAKSIIFQILCATDQTELIPIENALTRIIAGDIRAPRPVPAFPASIKDGYAVKASDGIGRRMVRSACAAGDKPETSELQAGEIIRISTGAHLPPGANAVVQIEDTILVEATENGDEEKIVEITVAPKVGQDIRQVGSDIQVDTVVLQKGNPITAAYIGVLAMLGFTQVLVIRRPSVGVISTGNELQNPKEVLKPGQIHDSNKVTLLCLLKSYGYRANDCGIARDMPNNVKATFEKAFQYNDLIITSGGVSMGEYDILKQVLIQDFGAVIHFGRVNMKPGKPTVFTTLNYKGKQKIVFALPGNPVSCCVTSLLFVIPALKHMEGDTVFKGWPTITVTLEHSLVNNDIRPEYVRLTVFKGDNNQWLARSTGNQISSRLNSMVNANCLLLVPGKSVFEKGSSQFALLFDHLF